VGQKTSIEDFFANRDSGRAGRSGGLNSQPRRATGLGGFKASIGKVIRTSTACTVLASGCKCTHGNPGGRNDLFPMSDEEQPIEIPINGVLDLHTFRPREVKDLVTDYLAACRERGIFEVRIIHGKGIGQLRVTVHALLAKHPDVTSFCLDHPQYGGWGATLVQLRRAEPEGDKKHPTTPN
jgi:hypothetical protein